MHASRGLHESPWRSLATISSSTRTLVNVPDVLERELLALWACQLPRIEDERELAGSMDLVLQAFDRCPDASRHAFSDIDHVGRELARIASLRGLERDDELSSESRWRPSKWKGLLRYAQSGTLWKSSNAGMRNFVDRFIGAPEGRMSNARSPDMPSDQ